MFSNYFKLRPCIMIRATIFLALFSLGFPSLNGQKNIRNFIFGHSLINHANPINTTPSQETSIPHWFAELAKSAGNQYAIDGQYGFLPQHANLPPIAQWGFDNAEGAWNSDDEDFSDADFNSILITPGNFIQWQGPEEDYPSDPTNPLEATVTVFDWCNEQEENLKYYIYENWPDMAPYLQNNFPPSNEEWKAYNDYLNSDFHDWFVDYYSQVSQDVRNNCISFVPVGTLISKLLQKSPYNQIPITQLYEDNAPHGRPTIYFLASLVTYMSIYEEEAPLNYEADPIIHPLITDNYQDVVEYFWSELNKINEEGELTIFCEASTTNTVEKKDLKSKITLYPNPTNSTINILGEATGCTFQIYNVLGDYQMSTSIDATNEAIDITDLQSGTYIIIGRNKTGALLCRELIVKI